MSVPKTVSLLQRSHGRSWRETLLESSGNRVRVATGNGLAEDIGGWLPMEMGRDRRAMQYVFGPAKGELPEGAIRLLPQQHGVTLADEDSPVSFQFFEVNGASAAPVCFEGRVSGVVWEDDLARYCQVGDLYPTDLTARPGVQCRQLYEVFERVLEAHGFVFTDCIRTWLYPSNVLDWYDTLNEVRTRFYEERGVFDRIVPASTGIGAGNTRGATIIGSLLAVKPKGSGLTLHRHSSPLQCSAEDYGSSFSRAVEVRHPEFRELYVSGTASIEPGGLTVHVGDIERQIQLSLDVMEAILKKQQFSWTDVSRSIAYFKHRNEHLPVFQKIARERALPDFPMVCFQADICRPDLLFEIEADAIALS